MSDNTEPEFPDIHSFLKQYRTWCLRGVPKAEQEDRFTLLVALVRPDGRIITSMPGWRISEEGPDEESFRQEMHQAIDVVLAKRHQTEAELDAPWDEDD